MKELNDISKDGLFKELYFPTTVFSVSCSGYKQLNSQLLSLIYAERERDQQGIQRSNFRELGGWHSHNNLHQINAYNPLTERVLQAGKRMSSQLGYHPSKELKIGTMWSIINAPGSSNKSHIHPDCHWSGVYYVQVPDSGGDIEFTDPRTSHIMNQPSFDPKSKRSKDNWTKVRFTPKAGTMIIFPSWLYHSVEPNMSNKTGKEGERVIISFNIPQVSGR